ncbi:MAG: hypothetical protein DCC68_00290 [Planctomycetota bacterium]|nr:MAG: hypothetical protein DCC68_00290 [Planctomycetota bacterium]
MKGNLAMRFLETATTMGRSMVRWASGAAVVLALAASSRAEVLTTATYDTDSYVYFGLNAARATEITLGAPLPPGVDPHYNVGFVKFDVSELSLSGAKYLELEPNTATAVLPSAVAIARLYGNTDDYFAAGSAPGRTAWLAANAYGQPPLATMSISASGGKHYADITPLVNHWIASPADNYGIALWRVGGNDFDSPELFSMNDPLGRGPAINSVPEPGTVALASMAAVGLAVTCLRRRAARAARPSAA